MRKHQRAVPVLLLGAAALLGGCAERAAAPTETVAAGLAEAPTAAAPAATPTAATQSDDPAAGTPPAAPVAPAVQTPATRDAAAMQNAFAEVARTAEPAVVTITTQGRRSVPVRNAPGRPGGPGNGGGDPFEEFFRRFGPFRFQPNRAPLRDYDAGPATAWPVQDEGGGGGGGLGSGLIYSPSGLIMTNAHVVAGSDTVTVRMADGREFRRARVLGTDPRTDIAVVKIDGTNLPTVKLGDSSKVRVGDWAIAVGNPFGLEQTLTVGVISAQAREVALTEAGSSDYLQTDASINPGNSGGPLLDIYGRVVGVNNAIYSRSGGNVGIGFAIPINTAREIANILAREGRVRRARLGVAITDADERAAAFGLPAGIKGALVEGVEPNGPGAQAGLRAGDVITAVNDTPITRSQELVQRISSSPIGSTVRLTVRRGGETRTVNAKLVELRDGQTASAAPAQDDETTPEGAGAAPSALGLRLAPITADIARRLNLPAGSRGVVVAGIADGSPAEGAGLQPGDVIEQVAQTPVSSPQDVSSAVKRILSQQKGLDKSVALYINRGGQRRFVIVRSESD